MQEQAQEVLLPCGVCLGEDALEVVACGGGCDAEFIGDVARVGTLEQEQSDISLGGCEGVELLQVLHGGEGLGMGIRDEEDDRSLRVEKAVGLLAGHEGSDEEFVGLAGCGSMHGKQAAAAPTGRTA